MIKRWRESRQLMKKMLADEHKANMLQLEQSRVEANREYALLGARKIVAETRLLRHGYSFSATHQWHFSDAKTQVEALEKAADVLDRTARERAAA